MNNNIDNILKKRSQDILKRNNVINDNKNIINNDNNVNTARKKKYSLDKSTFTPNTPESHLAETIAIYFSDLENFAFYYCVVNKLGTDRAYSAFRSFQVEEEEKKGTKYEIRFPKNYFAWKWKRGILT